MYPKIQPEHAGFPRTILPPQGVPLRHGKARPDGATPCPATAVRRDTVSVRADVDRARKALARPWHTDTAPRVDRGAVRSGGATSAPGRMDSYTATGGDAPPAAVLPVPPGDRVLGTLPWRIGALVCITDKRAGTRRVARLDGVVRAVHWRAVPYVATPSPIEGVTRYDATDLPQRPPRGVRGALAPIGAAVCPDGADGVDGVRASRWEAVAHGPCGLVFVADGHRWTIAPKDRGHYTVSAV